MKINSTPGRKYNLRGFIQIEQEIYFNYNIYQEELEVLNHNFEWILQYSLLPQ